MELTAIDRKVVYEVWTSLAPCVTELPDRMKGPVFRISVLLLALLLQLGGFRSEPSTRDAVSAPAVSAAQVQLPGPSDVETEEEDSSEELPGADDAPGADLLSNMASAWRARLCSSAEWPAAGGLAPSRAPSAMLFKPPRA
jgi:hypothetical protein